MMKIIKVMVQGVEGEAKQSKAAENVHTGTSRTIRS
jgi:hypothetical protein